MATMPERMAVIETEVKGLKVQVAEIACDVKKLLLLQTAADAAAKANDASAVAAREDRWHRNPLLLSAIAIGIAFVALVIDNLGPILSGIGAFIERVLG